MLENLLPRIQVLWSKLVSTIQTHPWIILVIVALLVGVYLVTLPRRRRSFLEKNFQVYSREPKYDWLSQTFEKFPGKVIYRKFGRYVMGFSYKGQEKGLHQFQEKRSHEDPDGTGQWSRDWSDENDKDWVITKISQSKRQRSRMPFVVIASIVGLILATLLITRVIVPTIQDRREHSTEVVETPIAPIPPTMSAPLACDEDGSCVEQGAFDSTPEPEVEPESVKLEDSVLIIDLDQEARRTPSAIEARLNDWLSKLPSGPSISLPLIDQLAELIESIFASGGTATLIQTGEEGFILISYQYEYLKYQYLDNSLAPIGDSITVFANCGTILAGQEETLRWGICVSDEGEWRVSKWGKGSYNVWAFEGGVVIDPTLKGTLHRFQPLWLLALLPLAALGYFLWRRR